MSFEVDSDRKQLRALSHPVRLRVLSLLTGTAMSSTELGGHLGMSQAAISFHVRQLAAAGLIELAETRVVRGGQEKRYRLSTPQPVAARVDMVSSAAALSSEIRRRLLEDHPDDWDLFSDAEIYVDERSWSRCTAAITEAMRELHEAATEQKPGAVKVSATSLLFRSGIRPSRPHKVTRKRPVPKANADIKPRHSAEGSQQRGQSRGDR